LEAPFSRILKKIPRNTIFVVLTIGNHEFSEGIKLEFLDKVCNYYEFLEWNFVGHGNRHVA